MIQTTKLTGETGLEIAIIGMSGKFPGARNLEEYWDNLKNGVESLTFYTDDDLKAAGFDSRVLDDPGFVKCRGGMMADIYHFDASFFGYIPVEAEIMDPQIRLFHESVWAALENAGHGPVSHNGLIGLYGGCSVNWRREAAARLSDKGAALGVLAAGNLSNKDFMCTAVSHKLNLKGPSVSVQVACATSLVAIHLACRALLTRECDIALAGGIALKGGGTGYMYREGMILSPDGHCRAFDCKAAGTSASSGVGVVALKKLKKALEDGDYIHAVIKGTAINNDGFRKAGYTAPSIEGQAEVIKMAHHVSGIEPDTVGYVETHGTATIIGDPIELEGLKLAFNSEKKGFCAIGSVKTNIGHTDSASGVAGLIKTVLALKHKLIPPSLHYETPNPKIDFESSPFFVNHELREWKRGNSPLRAGVSSFGVGGTNAHAILEEAPEREPSSKSRACQMIMLSAKTPTALDHITGNLASWLKTHPGTPLADVAYTLQAGRDVMAFGKVAVPNSAAGMVDALEDPASPAVQTFNVPARKKNIPVIFMFPGQGAQYVGMGQDLYLREPLFRDEMDRCFSLLEPLTDFNLKEVLYPSSPLSIEEADGDEEESVNRTEVAQPLLFVLEYCLARLLMKWGIIPDAMIGHSIGEYTAACLAGVFSLEDALRLVTARGRLMQSMPPGAMLSVLLPREQLKPLLNKKVSLAAVNSPSHCVVSGSPDAIDRFGQMLGSNGVRCRKLHTSHAFHSAMMEPVLEPFAGEVAQVGLLKTGKEMETETGIPFISNLTGLPVTPGEAADPSRWSRHIRETVNFHAGVEHLLEKENALFIEVGPGNVLSTFVRAHEEKSEDKSEPVTDGSYKAQAPSPFTVNLLRHPGEETSDDLYLFNKIGLLWLYGVSLDWQAFYSGETRHRVPLPGYPFEGRKFLLDEERPSLRLQSEGAAALTKQEDIAQWFYIPSWKRTRFPLYRAGEEPERESGCCLLFLDGFGIGSEMAARLREEGRDVVTVKTGDGFVKESEGEYRMAPGDANGYERLFRELEKNEKFPRKVFHLWSLSDNMPDKRPDKNPDPLTPARFKQAQETGFESLVNIAAQLGNLEVSAGDAIDIQVITDHLMEVTGAETLCPEKTTILGPVTVIPQENPFVRCRCIDIRRTAPGRDNTPGLVRCLLSEENGGPPETIVAYRGIHRWVRVFERERLEEPVKQPALLKERGVYIIAGGLGNIGFTLAQHLASYFRARLVLTGSDSFPAPGEWDEWVNTHDETEGIRQKIEKIRQMEKDGSEVWVVPADPSDEKQMRNVLEGTVNKWGKPDGLFHLADGLDDLLTWFKELERESGDSQFYSRVRGFLVLTDLLKDLDIDFCFFMSPLSCILGGPGTTSYVAVNLFMDAFVQYRNRSGGFPWFSSNWDGWKFGDRQLGTSIEHLFMTPGEGIRALGYLLSDRQVPREPVIVSTGDLHARLRKWGSMEGPGEKGTEKGTGRKKEFLQPRPQLTRPYVSSGNEMEEQLVEIWRDFFRIDPIGIHDDFFELGGDSLKGMQLVEQYKKLLGEVVYIRVIFEFPTIAQLAEFFIQNYPGGGVKHKKLR